jgi:hypothetical protein
MIDLSSGLDYVSQRVGMAGNLVGVGEDAQ